MLHLGIFFKYPREMTLGRKSQIVSDCSKRFIRITEEALCFFRFFFKNKICQAFPGLFLKPPGKIRAAQKQFFCQLFRGREKLALLDIGITEGKGIVYIHPARISQPLNFLPGSVYASGCDEKGNTTDALLKEVPAWQPGSWYETCKGKPNQKELEAMLGRPYHFVKPRKGQFTMDNSVEEMKDASSAGAPLRSMQISGGMKGGLIPALLEFANGHFLRGIWKMITG